MTDGQMTYWLDHKGGLLGPGPVDNPTGWGEYDRLTHRIMRPQSGQLIQAVSWCGHRVQEVPGRGEIDCPECLALIAEEPRSGTWAQDVSDGRPLVAREVPIRIERPD